MRTRTVVEDHSVTLIVDDACQRYEWMEDVFKGVTWRLARQPELGREVPHQEHSERFFLFKQDPWPELGMPGILVLYTYSETEVHLLDAKVLPP